MGFFDFLKKREEKEKESVNFEDLDEWLKKYVEKRHIGKKLNKFKKEIELKIDSVRDCVGNLENANLRNEKIPERAKNIMEGNRQSYAQKVIKFLDGLVLPEDYSEIENFNIYLTNKMEELTKETQRSFFVLKEFLRDNVLKIVFGIKEIEKTTISFKNELKGEGLEKIDKINGLLKEFKDSKKLIKVLNEEKIVCEREFDSIKLKEKKVEHKLEELKSGKSFKEYLGLKEELENYAKFVDKEGQEIISGFSVLEKALKKYKRGSFDEELIDKYLKNPVVGLIDDAELKLVTVLSKLKENMSKLELKDKKEEKSLEVINEFDMNFLMGKRESLVKLSVTKEEIEKNMKNNLILADITDQEVLISRVNGEVKEKERDFLDVQKRIESVKPESLKKDITGLLDELDVSLLNIIKK